MKYFTAGAQFTLTYHVADASGNAIVGKVLTINGTSPTGNAGPLGSYTATTDNSGDATFTITNTNTAETSESYRWNKSLWSDATGTEYKYEFSAANVGRTDLLWGHVVTTTVPSYTADVTLQSTTLNGPAGAYGNGWWNDNAPSNNYVKYIKSGQTFTVTYKVADPTTGAGLSGKTLTLGTATGGAGVAATLSGSLSAVTNASGIATFTLTSTNAAGTGESIRADRSAWADAVGNESKLDFTPSSLSEGGSFVKKDLLWTHLVSGFTADAPSSVYVRGNSAKNSVVVGFTAGSQTGQADTGYKIIVKAGSNATVSPSPVATTTATPGATSKVVTVPTPAAGLFNVSATVQALNSSANSDAVGTTGAITAIATTAPATPKAAPVFSLASGLNVVTVTYAAVVNASNGGATILKHQYSTDGGSTWIDAPASPFTIAAAGSGVSKSVKMRGVNSVGNGLATAVALSAASFKVPQVAPAFTVTAGVNKVVVTIPSPLATASNGGSAVTGYQYQTSTNGVTFGSWSSISLATATNVATSANTRIYVKVRAVNAVGEGTATAVASSATSFNVPGKPVITAVAGTGKVTFTLANPAANGGSAVTSLQYNLLDGSGWQTYTGAVVVNGVATEDVVIKARAVNAVGNGVAAAKFGTCL